MNRETALLASLLFLAPPLIALALAALSHA